LVPSPEPRAVRYGLLAAANGPLDLPPHGAGGGVSYEPVSCGVAHTFPVECDTTPPEKVFDPGDDWVDAAPFLVYASLACGSAGHTPAELEGKVRRRLAAGEQTQAEAALADVIAADPALAVLTSADDGSIVAAVAELEQWLYERYGYVGYLHAPPRAAAYAMDHGLLLRDGPVWRTAMGSVWVFGGGYPDDGLIHITGQVTVWRSPDVQVPPAGQVFNRTTNQYALLAEREYAVAYDCLAAQVPLDLGAPS
jgi:hypothetical protein